MQEEETMNGVKNLSLGSLGIENRKFDVFAQRYYMLWRNDKKHLPIWAFLKREDRDYWRGLTQIRLEEN